MSEQPSSPWPNLNDFLGKGLQKGEIFAFMSRPPEQLPQEDLEEIERRAYAIVNRRGRRYPKATNHWKKASITFATHNLMVQSNPLGLDVRVYMGRPDRRGVRLFELAWQKRAADNKLTHRADKARIALRLLRDLMILDDLADV